MRICSILTITCCLPAFHDTAGHHGRTCDMFHVSVVLLERLCVTLPTASRYRRSHIVAINMANVAVASAAANPNAQSALPAAGYGLRHGSSERSASTPTRLIEGDIHLGCGVDSPVAHHG